MFGPLFLIVAIIMLPAFVAKLVAAFFLIYGIKIILEELKDPNVPDRRKAWITLVVGLTLHVVVFHGEWLTRIHAL